MQCSYCSGLVERRDDGKAPTGELSETVPSLGTGWKQTFTKRIAEMEAGCNVYDASNSLQEGSPRSKRRRMLLFPGATEESTISETSFDAGLDSYASQCADLIPNCEDLEKFDMPMPSSPSSLWYQNDDLHFTLNEVLGPQKWMARSFDEFPENDQCDPTKLIIPVSDNPVSCSDYQHPSSCESDALDWPSTPFALSPNSGRGPSAPLARPKSVTPVAYPFALLKPCGAQGDVTLNDINQRISRPPSQPHLGGGDSRHPPPQLALSPSEMSPGRSGKSVVGLTKIHTEGNGTITIVRTRGG